MTINDDSGPQSNTSNKSSDNTRGPSADKENDLSVNSPSIFEKERQVLNLYGRYILIRRRGTIIFLTILVGILISTALVATCNNLILSSTSVYRDGPCPAFGPMECFAGHDAIYFACNTGLTAPFPVSDAAGTCFRWIARDITISDVLTQLGVATGLLLALGNIAQAIIRIYLLAFNKRLDSSILFLNYRNDLEPSVDMGSKESTGKKLDSKTVYQYSTITKLSEDEIQEWYQEFHKECPNGKLTRNMFGHIFKRHFHYRHSKPFCDAIFEKCDTNKDGSLEFKEFLIALSPVSQLDFDAHIRLLMDVYDTSRDGILNEKEMKRMIKAMSNLVEGFGLSNDEIEELTYEIVNSYKNENPGKQMTKDRLLERLKNNETIRQMLAPNMEDDNKHGEATTQQSGKRSLISEGIE
ncbi:unnamed protein product [Rotaria socialis]|uniref:EF-hand domain-containing protein n=1 Tax=Rotaria socialis TaxID=392032 RepID=A0A818JEZ6_9BILA|nr:unnamed protein product [Rotaria socialis]CAF4525805.1 unnamed protein product [Rotaria socialis]